eukprot:3641314-Pyramimonas_sp.AAC.1
MQNSRGGAPVFDSITRMYILTCNYTDGCREASGSSDHGETHLVWCSGAAAVTEVAEVNRAFCDLSAPGSARGGSSIQQLRTLKCVNVLPYHKDHLGCQHFALFSYSNFV